MTDSSIAEGLYEHRQDGQSLGDFKAGDNPCKATHHPSFELGSRGSGILIYIAIARKGGRKQCEEAAPLRGSEHGNPGETWQLLLKMAIYRRMDLLIDGRRGTSRP